MGARSPEELETLFEDALLLGDVIALTTLFAPGAVLAVNDDPPARGDGIPSVALARWGAGGAYLADPRRVLVARDIALIVAEQGINVARRDRGDGWRYAIVRQTVAGNDEGNGEEKPSWP